MKNKNSILTSHNKKILPENEKHNMNATVEIKMSVF